MLRALSPSICRNSRVMTVAGRPVQRFLNDVGDSAHPSQRVQAGEQCSLSGQWSPVSGAAF
jgi:hypothetical protein